MRGLEGLWGVRVGQARVRLMAGALQAGVEALQVRGLEGLWGVRVGQARVRLMAGALQAGVEALQVRGLEGLWGVRVGQARVRLMAGALQAGVEAPQVRGLEGLWVGPPLPSPSRRRALRQPPRLIVLLRRVATAAQVRSWSLGRLAGVGAHTQHRPPGTRRPHQHRIPCHPTTGGRGRGAAHAPGPSPPRRARAPPCPFARSQVVGGAVSDSDAPRALPTPEFTFVRATGSLWGPLASSPRCGGGGGGTCSLHLSPTHAHAAPGQQCQRCQTRARAALLPPRSQHLASWTASMLRAPLSFFHTNPAGRVLNRCVRRETCVHLVRLVRALLTRSGRVKVHAALRVLCCAARQVFQGPGQHGRPLPGEFS